MGIGARLLSILTFGFNGRGTNTGTGVAARLSWLVVAVSIPLLMLSTLAIWQVHESEKGVQEGALLEQARTLVRLADREAELVQTRLSVLASAASLARGDLVTFEGEMQALSARHAGAAITLTDSHGVDVLSTRQPPGSGLPAGPSTAPSQTALSAGKPLVTNLVQGQGPNEMIVVVSVPVVLAGETSRPAYALSAAIPRATLAALFAAVKPADVPGWRAALVDRDARIIVRSQGDEDRIGVQLRPQFVTRLTHEQDGFVRDEVTIDGVSAVFAFSHAPFSHFAALLAVPTDVFDAPLRADLVRTLGIGGSLLAAGLLCAFLVAQRIVQALRQVERAHESAPIPTGIREIDDLAARLGQIGAERDEVQRAMQYQLNLLRAVTESTAEAIFLTDPQGRISFANVEAERLSGWQQDALIGQGLHELVMPRRRDGSPYPRWQSPVAQVLRQGVAKLGHEEVFFRRDNTAVEVECSSAPVVVEQETVGAVLIARDVTPRRRTDRALRESEARLRDLVQTLDLATILVRDLDDSIIFWSRGCEDLYGWTVAEAVAQNAGQLLHTAYPNGRAVVEEALARDGAWSGDLDHTCRDGRRITVSAHKVLRCGPDGQPLAVMECLTDVTGLRAAEADLLRLNSELEQRVATEIAAREAAQSRAVQAERMQALGQLAGGIAHDFNNVLQAVASGAALIDRRPADTLAVQHLANVIAEAAGRGASITRRMLAFARRSELEAEAIEVPLLLQSLSEICGYTLGAAIQVKLSLDRDLPPALADKAQLETALVNLATNARDAMPNGGVITLMADTEIVGPGVEHRANLAPGAYVRLLITDTGTGIEQRVLARVAEPFFTTKGVGKGTGLGLSMVKGFAEQSEGGFAIESTPGNGTTVTIWLPQAAADPEPIATPDHGSGATDHRPDPESRRLLLPEVGRVLLPAAGRVLLVDDDMLVRETLGAQLEDAGYVVLPASSGEEALALLQQGLVADVMITDLSMPGMNGLSLIRSAQIMRPGLPAMLLTGYAGDAASLAVDGAVSGSYSLIRKPVSGVQLTGRVAAMLESVSG